MRFLSIISRKGKLTTEWLKLVTKVRKVSPLLSQEPNELAGELASFFKKYGISFEELTLEELTERVELIIASKAFEGDSVAKTLEILDGLGITDTFVELITKLLASSVFPYSVTSYLKELCSAYSKR